MKRVLNVKVGEPASAGLARARDAMKMLDSGKTAKPYFGVGFESLPQLLAVFTTKRWQLVAFLRENGPLSVAELARRLKRNYRNVHDDVSALAEWLIVERDAKGLAHVPWDEIDVRMPLAGKKAA